MFHIESHYRFPFCEPIDTGPSRHMRSSCWYQAWTDLDMDLGAMAPTIYYYYYFNISVYLDINLRIFFSIKLHFAPLTIS